MFAGPPPPTSLRSLTHILSAPLRPSAEKREVESCLEKCVSWGPRQRRAKCSGLGSTLRSWGWREGPHQDSWFQDASPRASCSPPAIDVLVCFLSILHSENEYACFQSTSWGGLRLQGPFCLAYPCLSESWGFISSCHWVLSNELTLRGC